MKELTKNLTDSTQYLIKPSSSSPVPDPETSGITSISSPPSITGSNKTESTTNTKPISEEPNSTPSVQSTMPVCSISLDSTPSPPSEEWLDGPDTTEILTWKSTFQSCHLRKSFRSSGTEHQSLSED
jgi:hypothetical protein